MRANRLKRAPLMTARRWVTLIVLFVLLVLASINAYYRYVQLPVWSEEKTAESNAMERGGLSSVTSSYSYVWDEPVWVVKGKDSNDLDTFVWLKKDSTITLRATDGLTKTRLQEQFLREKPDAQIAHIRLGLFGGEPVWEVFYARNQSSQLNHFYDFYRFRDGSLIVMYKLPSQ
ncbi:DUF5590 domain-containing protein [Paenibacillus sp. R14(2021)]|uniref:cell wall elongation regulator TseB-like domain-containing protein n=1 Tax=Paenibacillus sp. R14(2021) TaxID=2859228 RepID=UPI001C6119B6|nr:DUF5590 domain-containing protein [Paenibacillus sp. R14(2021)]